MHRIDEIRWDITKRCNLRCKHCYVGDSLTSVKTPDDLSTQEVVTLIRKFANEGVKRIQYLGGEPFARPDFLTILEETADQGLMFIVNTNGSFIDRAAARLLSRLPRWAITFSLDGPSAATNDPVRGKGSFERCVRGIRAVISEKASSHPTQTVAVNSVLTATTVGMIDAYFDLADRLELDVLQFNSLDFQGFALTQGQHLAITPAQLLDAAIEISRREQQTPREIRQVYASNIVRKYLADTLGTPFELSYGGCKAGVHGVYVDHKGRMFSCSELTYGRYPEHAADLGQSQDAMTPMADALLSEPFEAIQDLRDRKIHRSQYTPCRTCEFQLACHPCALPSLKSDTDINLLLCEEAHRRLNGTAYAAPRALKDLPEDGNLVVSEVRIPEDGQSRSVTAGLCK